MKVLISVFSIILWLQLTAPTPPLISLDMIKHLIHGWKSSKTSLSTVRIVSNKKENFMVAWKYEISLLVLKNISIVRSAHS